MSFWTNIMTEAGVIKVDINNVVAKIIKDEQLVLHEVQAFINWGIAQAPTLAADLNTVTPIVAALTGAVTTVVTGNPVLGSGTVSAITAAVDLVNNAMKSAQSSVNALSQAAAEVHASQSAGDGVLVQDTKGLLSIYQTVAGTSQSVSAVKTAVIAAAQTIQAATTPAAPAAA